MSSPSEEAKIPDAEKGDLLERIKTSGSITLPPEVFEQLYLAPKNAVKGQLRGTFGNPTPVALGGFLLCTTPLSCELLGWRDSGGLGAATIGTYFYFGGILLLIGGVGEFLLGNNFPMTVFTLFGAFWFTFGATLTPYYNAQAAYASDPSMFYNSFAYFLVSMLVLCFIFFIASVRTNICFFVIFLLLLPTFGCLAGAFFKLGHGDMALATKLQHAGAGLLLAVTIIGWYIFMSLVLAGVDFPLVLPLGDLSTIIKGRTDLAKKKEQ